MKGFLDRPIGNTQIIFNQIFSVSISSLYFVFFFPFFLLIFLFHVLTVWSLCLSDLSVCLISLSVWSLSLSLSLSLSPPNVAILLKSSQIKAIYYIRLFYKFLWWGTHLYMSLFPSICPSVCCAPYLRNCTLSNHTFW